MEKTLEQTNKPGTNLLRVVLFGPESTGKTTLANELASLFNTSCAPEFMREYLQQKWSDRGEKCTKDDLLPIAYGQMEGENQAAKNANRILFCDTNLLQLKVYSEYYYDGYCPDPIEEYSLKNRYDLYLITYIDTPWELDDLRDRPRDRLELFDIFENVLKSRALPYGVIKGKGKDRLDMAVEHIKNCLEEHAN